MTSCFNPNDEACRICRDSIGQVAQHAAVDRALGIAGAANAQVLLLRRQLAEQQALAGELAAALRKVWRWCCQGHLPESGEDISVDVVEPLLARYCQRR